MAPDDLKVVFYNEIKEELWDDSEGAPVYIDDTWFQGVLVPFTRNNPSWKMIKTFQQQVDGVCLSAPYICWFVFGFTET